jgi:hypothetical protein
MPTGLKMGRHMGKSEILERLAIENYLTGQVDPFPYSDPKSIFDGTSGGVKSGMLGNGPDAATPGFPGAGNCVFGGFQHTNMRNSWLAGETPPGDLTPWPTTIDNLMAYFLFQGAPTFAAWREQNGNPEPGTASYVAYFTWCQDNGYDQGCDIGVALLWFLKNGIGNMGLLARFAGVPTNGQFYQGGIGVFGVFYDGLLVTNEMMNASETGQGWDGTQTDFIGGHCAPHIYRGPDRGECDTWDLVQEFGWANWRVTREEGAVLITASIVAAPDGTYHGVAIADLDSDIATLAKEFPVETPEQRRELITSTVNRAPSIGTIVKVAALIVKDVTELAAEGAKDAAQILADIATGGDAKAAGAALTDVETLVGQVESDVKAVEQDLGVTPPLPPGTATGQAGTSAGGPILERPRVATLREHLDWAVAVHRITAEQAVALHRYLAGDAYQVDAEGDQIHDVNDPVKVDEQGRPIGVPFSPD